MERWFRSLRAELTGCTLLWNVPYLLRLLRVYETHYNSHRPHRTLGPAGRRPPGIQSPGRRGAATHYRSTL
jgi:hypothetical protein